MMTLDEAYGVSTKRSSTPCPKCGSHNVSWTDRPMNGLALASSYGRQEKEYHCDHCGGHGYVS